MDKNVLTLLFLIFWTIHQGQDLTPWQVPFLKNNTLKTNALAGGLNAPQFSLFDLNADSLPDIFVFDRGGDKAIAFLNMESGFVYVPQFDAVFPQMSEWALLRDYDGDGIEDIFTYAEFVPGITVYKGSRDSGALQYEKLVFGDGSSYLKYTTLSGGRTNIYVSSVDLPDINDIDGDGDLDILSFQLDGTQIKLYHNFSVEAGFGRDTFIYSLEDPCWGKFSESFNNNEVLLSPTPDACAQFAQFARLHGGSTSTSLDLDLDADMDLLLGDFTFPNILSLINGGNAKKAWITHQEPLFPNQDPINIEFFPAVFRGDFNGDAVLDLIASPNETDARANTKNAWFYQGSESVEGLSFSLIQKDFLVDDMIDLGTEALPGFFDYNGDGLLDILAGSRFHEGYDPENPSQLFLFENTGTESNPEFSLVDSDFLMLKDNVNELDALAPTGYDIDTDGDQDLIIGNKRGKLIYVENIASSPNSPFLAGEIVYPWFGIDVGFGAYPTVIDIDNDGLPDLLIGEETGTVNLLRNIGTPNDPKFSPDLTKAPNMEKFGNVDTRQNLSIFGFSSPHVVETRDATLLVTGSAVGNYLTYVLPINGEISNALDKIQTPLDQIRDGNRSRGQFADLNKDGYFDMITGNSRGGLRLYHTPFKSGFTVSSIDIPKQDLIRFYPNPVKESLHLSGVATRIEGYTIYDRTGKQIFNQKQSFLNKTIPLSFLRPGMYFLKVNTQNKMVVAKLIKI